MKYKVKFNTKRLFFILCVAIFFFSAAIGIKAQYGAPGAMNRTGYACTPRYFNCSNNSDDKKSNLIQDIELNRITPRKPLGYTYSRNDVLMAELGTLYGEQTSFVCYKSSDSSNIIDIAAPANVFAGELTYKIDNMQYQNIVVERTGKLFMDYIKSDDTIIAALNQAIGSDGGSGIGTAAETARKSLLKNTLKSYISTGYQILLDSPDPDFISEQELLSQFKQKLRILPTDGNSAQAFTIPTTSARDVLSSLGIPDGGSDVLGQIYDASAFGLSSGFQIAEASGINLNNFVNSEILPLLNTIQSKDDFNSMYQRVNTGTQLKQGGGSFTEDEKDLLQASFISLEYINNYYDLFTTDSRSYNYFDSELGLQTIKTVIQYESNTLVVPDNGINLNSFEELIQGLKDGGYEDAIQVIKNNLGSSFQQYLNSSSSQRYLFAGDPNTITSIDSNDAQQSTIGTTSTCKNTGGCALVSSNPKLVQFATNPITGEVEGQITATGGAKFFAKTTESIQDWTQQQNQLIGELNCQRCYANGEAMAVEQTNDTATQFNVYICDTSAPGNVTVKQSVGSLEATLGSLITDPANQPYYDACFASGGIYTAIGCVDPTPVGIITGLVRITLGVVGGIALLQLIYVGIMYQLGDEAKIKEARSRLIATITGVAVLIFSILILRIIGVNILDILPAGAI